MVGAIIFRLATKARDATARKLSGATVVVLLILVVGIVMNRVTPPMGPLINDITTDTTNPPAFDAVVPYRPDGSNPIEYGGEAVAARQMELYPDIQPLLSELTAEAAFERALATAQAMGWEIIEESSLQGIIEAVDTTTFFRFKDDIAIRVVGTPTGSTVDIRSRSRVGRSDLGKNAARIREYVARFTG